MIEQSVQSPSVQRRYFMFVPRPLAGRLPFPRALRPIGFSIPEKKIVAESPPNADVQRGALEWARVNSTRRRTKEFLREMGFPQP
jgi:hypothetical protein